MHSHRYGVWRWVRSGGPGTTSLIKPSGARMIGDPIPLEMGKIPLFWGVQTGATMKRGSKRGPKPGSRFERGIWDM